MNKINDCSLKLYGVRGSFAPTNGDTTIYGVNTTCVRVNIGPHVVVFDAGTGIINLGHDLIKEMKAGKSSRNVNKIHLIFTHTHIDHLMGFPYFSMIYLPQTTMHIIAPRMLNQSIQDILQTWMNPNFFPVTLSELPSRFRYYEFGESKQLIFTENDFLILNPGEENKKNDWIGRITCLRNFTHPKGGSYIYKVESKRGDSIVFATDIEGFIGGDQRLVKFARNAKFLIHDAQYSLPDYQMFQGFGHSTYQMACDVAKKARVEKLILFHHDPKYSDKQLGDLETAAKDLFLETYMANESMEFDF